MSAWRIKLNYALVGGMNLRAIKNFGERNEGCIVNAIDKIDALKVFYKSKKSVGEYNPFYLIIEPVPN